MSTGHAEAQVDPPGSNAQAVFTAPGAGDYFFDLIQVLAFHRPSPFIVLEPETAVERSFSYTNGLLGSAQKQNSCLHWDRFGKVLAGNSAFYLSALRTLSEAHSQKGEITREQQKMSKLRLHQFPPG
jgi:hypothetical protein